MSTKPNVYTLPVSAPMPQLYQVVCLSPGRDGIVRERYSGDEERDWIREGREERGVGRRRERE
jgi:hypothetical protein